LSEKLAYQLKGIESALTDERSALKNEISKTKRTYGLMGFVLGGIAVGVAK